MESVGDETKEGPGSPNLACPHCGVANLTSARVCQDCGRRLDLRQRPGTAPGLGADDALGQGSLSESEAAPRFRPLDSDDLVPAHEPVTFLDDALEPLIGGVQTCAQCGAQDFVSARFCRACGARFGAADARAGAGARSIGFARIAIVVVGLGAVIFAAAIAGRVWRQPPARLAAPALSPSALAPASPRAVVPAPPSDRLAAAPAPAAPEVGTSEEAPLPPSPSPPESAGLRMIADPVWMRRPGAKAVSALYPARAQDRGVQGQATIDCAVRRDGRLGGCRVIAEYPLRQGFGRATLSLAPSFRMRATTRSGRPVAGRRVRVPILWRLSESG